MSRKFDNLMKNYRKDFNDNKKTLRNRHEKKVVKSNKRYKKGDDNNK